MTSVVENSPTLVMPALVAGIHVFLSIRAKDVDGRVKPGHDGKLLPLLPHYRRALAGQQLVLSRRGHARAGIFRRPR
jgi:hypothetical protein